MRQFTAIAFNTLMELVRQPVFLLLMTCSAGFGVFLAAVPYFGFGDDPKLVKDSVLAVMLVSGLFGAVVSASASVAHELRSGTALAVLAKPVARGQFLLAKYLGIAGTLSLLTYVNLLSALLASRMAYDAYGNTDRRSLAIYFGALALAYAVAGLSNYFLRRPFVADAVRAVVVMTTLAFIVVAFFTHAKRPFGEPAEVDYRLVPAAVLILFALWILAGVALACATRFDLIPTLAICTGIFLLGLMSDYLFGRLSEPAWKAADLQAQATDPRRPPAEQKLFSDVLEKYDSNRDGRLDAKEQGALSREDIGRFEQAGLGGAWWASVLYTLVPNWQLFWLADALEGKNEIPWRYVATALSYLVGYLGATLVVALLLFERRELS